MKRKVERLASELAMRLSALHDVECVTAGEAAEVDILDPYFTLNLDVYHRGQAPRVEDRAGIYGDVQGLESSRHPVKDRFFLEDIPVHVDFRSVERIEDYLWSRGSPFLILRETGTHILYRLERGQVLFARSEWINRSRNQLKSLPDSFWNELVVSFSARMEHSLGDFGASVLRADPYFRAVARADFLKSTASVLFALSRAFEPPHRFVNGRLAGLQQLPEDFAGRWESLLRSEVEITPSRQYEIAKLVARSIFEIIPD